MGVKGTPDQVRQMKRIRDAVTRVLLKFQPSTEPAIVAGALLICVKLLLRNYPERTREELILGAVTFLKDSQQEEPEESGLILPVRPM